MRVRTAMAAQAREQGRYLGGRPPYGYRLADAGPHPNKAHAAWGRRAHRLEPDPHTAPIVRWMFAQRKAGHSLARIIPGVSMTFLAALVLDCGSDVPDAYLERQRVLPVHAAQLVHERDHVPHGTVRQALHAHELSAASLREARDRTCRDSVRVGHTHPPCPAVR